MRRRRSKNERDERAKTHTHTHPYTLLSLSAQRQKAQTFPRDDGVAAPSLAGRTIARGRTSTRTEEPELGQDAGPLFYTTSTLKTRLGTSSLRNTVSVLALLHTMEEE